MSVTHWKVYFFEPQPLLVFADQPAVSIPLKRLPQEGDFFRWNSERWRVVTVGWWREDDFGSFKRIEAVTAREGTVLFQECSGCGSFVCCTDACTVGLHREAIQPSAPRPSRPKKSRPGMLSAPLKDIVSRKGNTEELSCGHMVFYKHFKFVDRTALQRRCLECCTRCEGVERIVKRPRVL